jgi:glycosyltransferase involved in cell wall biosynthesis
VLPDDLCTRVIKKVLFKLSGALLRAHRYLDWRLKMGSGFKPRVVRYPDKRGTKKIVHVIGNFIVGGSSQLVVDIIEGTSDEYLHKIVVPYTEEQLAYQPVDIRAFSIAELRDFSAWLKNEKPEFVHIHYFVRPVDKHSDGALWYETVFKICEELRLKVIQNVNVPTHPNPSPAVVHNVFVSEYVRCEFNNVETESSVIYPGSDFSHFRNEVLDRLPDKNIGMVYRLDNDKLRPDAIEVFIEAVKKDPVIKAHIVGVGPLLDTYKRRVRDDGLESNISFTGIVSYDDLPEVYRRFSIFVAPVHDESFGQVTPFAMSMGLCVAGYDTGAISEILGSAETLAPTGDVEALAQIVIDLANDPLRRKALAISFQQRAHDLFSIERMIGEYRNLYGKVGSRLRH